MKTQALVLQHTRWSDNSAIITFFTPEAGKISCMAKGALKPKSRLKGALEIMNSLSIVTVSREGRDLHILSECQTENHFGTIRTIPEGLPFLYTLAETLRFSTHPGEENELFFRHMLRLLEWVNQNPQFMSSALINFFSGIFKILGIETNISNCAGCGTTQSATPVVFSVEMGQIFCGSCAKETNDTSQISLATDLWQAWQQAFLFQQLVRSQPAISRKSMVSFAQLVTKYLSHHLSTRLEIKSLLLYLDMLS